MAKSEGVNRAAMAKAEVQGAKLGDARLSARLETLTEAFALKPSESLPEIAMGDESSLEAIYRFLGNPRVKPSEVLAPHIEQTRKRCESVPRVLVIFDTTELRYSGEREELGRLTHDNSRGLFAHVGLTATPGTKDPLGVLHCETVVRKGPKKKKGQQTKGSADSESRRWHRGAKAAHELLPQAICVMDREADIFTLVSEMADRKQDFVIRAAQDRLTQEGKLWDLLDGAERLTVRDVDLSQRAPQKRKSARKAHPPRSARTATLELRARTVKLRTPQWMNAEQAESTGACHINVVHVVEPNPPAGEPAVEWVLLTSLPIATKQDVDFIVDAYTARWVIEEYFKALKSGCAIEKRQLVGLHSITNVLAVSLPIAWLLLRLRHLSRDAPDSPATSVISPLMLTVLRMLLAKNPRKQPPLHPTNRELTWGIAALGGHISNNGEPGLLVLGRGLAKLMFATEVAMAMQTSQDDERPGAGPKRASGHLEM